MNDKGRGPASRLRFEKDAPEEKSPGTCGRNVHKSRRGRRPVSDAGPAPGSQTRDAPDSRPHFGDADTPEPQDAPPTCGQNVHNSRGGGKLRQDDEKARPSERLRRDDEAPPPGDVAAAPDGEPAADSDGGDAPGSGAAPDSGPRPGGKKAAREARRYEKSGQRVEKSGTKLGKARDKLATPKNRPGENRWPGGGQAGAWLRSQKKFIKWNMKMWASRPRTRLSLKAA